MNFVVYDIFVNNDLPEGVAQSIFSRLRARGDQTMSVSSVEFRHVSENTVYF